jgi:uncharacterized membrane protein YdbT with pleckstrin-like domain
MITFQPDEKIQLIVRKYWFTFGIEVIKLFCIALLPLLLLLFGSEVWGVFSQASIANYSLDTIFLYFIFLYLVWLLFIWMKVFIEWTDYYLDAWYLTNQRIVDVEQTGFFHRNISSISYDRIQDVTIEIKGLIATHLDYGDLHVQSAGESREFVIRGIRHPLQIKERINSLRNGLREDKPAEI